MTPEQRATAARLAQIVERYRDEALEHGNDEIINECEHALRDYIAAAPAQPDDAAAGDITLSCPHCHFSWHFLSTYCPNCKDTLITLPQQVST